jgi:peptidoglycan/xylan/chitin deacetylase (PgdA/CDA1 family)
VRVLEATIVVTGEPLPRCLEALERQTQERSTFEVVVAGGAAAPTLRGRICILVGGDVVAAPGLVAAHLAAHAADERIYGIGPLGHEPSSPAAIALDRRFDVSGESRLDWSHAHAWNLSVPREALEAAGGLDGVTELAIRLEAGGYTARWIADAHAVRAAASVRRLLLERTAEGAAHGAALARQPALAPRLVGRFGDASPLELLLRRLTTALHVPSRPLAVLGRALPDGHLAQRWYSFVAGRAYWNEVRRRMPTDEWRRLARGVAVLMYHAFDDGDGEPNRFVVARRTFARQLRALSLMRFDVLSYDEFAERFAAGRLPSRRSVVMTIDDGYRDNATVAAQLLARRGARATIFLVSGRLDADNDWSEAPPLRGRPLLGTDEVEPLRTHGIDFGAHTASHPALPELDDEAIDREVGASRRELERLLGRPVRTFAYPYGRFDARTVAAVGRAGFVSACTTEPRLARLGDDPLQIPRLEINGLDSLGTFLLKVWFGWT